MTLEISIDEGAEVSKTAVRVTTTIAELVQVLPSTGQDVRIPVSLILIGAGVLFIRLSRRPHT